MSNAAEGLEVGGQRPEGAKQTPSPALPRGFAAVDSPADFRDSGALVVRMPCGIRSKEKLLAILADKLRFPGYFGWNWDALEECLRDLSWLPARQGVVIVHEDLPFGDGVNRSLYFSLLRNVLAHWSSDRSRSVRIVLPSGVEIPRTD